MPRAVHSIVSSLVVLASLAAEATPRFEISVAALTRGGYAQNELREELLFHHEDLPIAWWAVPDEVDLRRFLTLTDDGWQWLGVLSVQASLEVVEELAFHVTVDSGTVLYDRNAGDELVASAPAEDPDADPVPIYLPTTRRPYGWTMQGRSPAEEALTSGFVRELYARITPIPALELRVGKRLVSIGSGYVYDDFAVGVGLRAELPAVGGFPLSLTAELLLPARDWVSDAWTSPLVATELTLELSPLESIRVGGVYLHDAMNATALSVQGAAVALIGSLAAEAFPGSPMDDDLRSRTIIAAAAGLDGPADMGWLTVAFDLLLADAWFLHAHLVAGFGRADLRLDVGKATGETTTTDVRFYGFGGDVSVEWLVSRRLLVEAFGLLLTGDGDSAVELEGGESTYTGFVGVVPFWTFTNLFFRGGMNEALTERGAAPAGVAGRGVMGLGFRAETHPHDDVTIELTTAYLWAMSRQHDDQGLGYGLEIDLELRWQILAPLGATIELDALFPGSAFARSRPFWKALVGMDVAY